MAKHSRRSVSAPRPLSHSSVGTIELPKLTPTLIPAISRRDAPLSTASTARSRKSVEYGLGIDLAPQANQFPQICLGDSGWESLRFNADGKCSSPSRMT